MTNQFYRGAQPNLPFDPEYPDQRNTVRDRPPLRINDLGAMQPYLGDLEDQLIIQIQNNYDLNPLRIFAFNFWSTRQYQNDQFIELVYAFAAWVESLVLATPRVDPVQVILGEVEAFVLAASAMLTEQFPELRNFLPPEADKALHDNMQNWRFMVRQIHASQQQYNFQGNAGYQGRAGQQGGGNYAPRSSGGFNRNPQGGGGGYQPRQAAIPASQLRPSWEMNQDSAGPVIARSGFNRTPTPTPGPAPATTTPRTPYSGLRQAVADNAEPERAAASIPPTRTENVQVTYAKVDRPFDKVDVADGRYLIPAYQTDKVPVYTPTSPPEVFPRKSHILFYVVSPDDSLKEVIQEKSQIEKGGRTVNYLDHEMDEALRKLYKVNMGVFDREVVVPNVTHLKKLVPNKTGTIAARVPEEVKQELDEANAPRQLAKPIVSHSLSMAMYLARLELDRMGLEEDSTFLEFQVEEFDIQNTFDGALESVQKLAQCISYEHFLEVLMDLHRDEETMTDDLFDYINQRMTETFNRYLAKQMYLEVDLDDFAKDYPDFPTYCIKKFGEPVLDVVRKGAKEVIARSVSTLTSAEAVVQLKLGDETDPARHADTAVFVNRYSVTQLPWTMYEMEREWRLEGVVTDTNATKLHDAMTSVFARTQTNGTHVRTLYTRDGRSIYFSRSPILDDDFVVTIIPPNFMKEFMSKNPAL